MHDKQVFDYAVIRLVPQVEREEFLNVGVILFCKRKKYLGVKYIIDEKRIIAFNKHIDLQEIAQHLKSWKLIVDGGSDSGPIGQLDQSTRFKWLTATRSTIIQASKVHPGLTDDPNAALERCFERYVLYDKH